MAVTVETRRITDRHRREQIARSHRHDARMQDLWGSAEGGRLSPFRWRQEMLVAALVGYSESRELAGQYLDEYRFESIGQRLAGYSQTALDTAIAAGVLDSVSPFLLDNSYAAAAAAARNLMMRGGRDTVAATAIRDRRAVGWRRVTDGDPCTFCAMIVGRGAIYKSSGGAGALANKRFKGPGEYKFHNHCGCGIEVLYSDWEPTESESGWVASYEAAAAEALRVDGTANQNTVLWRMRRDGDFRDSPSRRTKQPAA